MASTAAFKHEHRIISITEQDLLRLKHMIESAKRFHHDSDYIESLEKELEEARIVTSERFPENVVTINSQVRVTNLASKRQMVYTLVFPRDANYSESRISVLAPIGAALLGQKVGDVIDLVVPGGRKRLRVDAILSADEAPGQAASEALNPQ